MPPGPPLAVIGILFAPASSMSTPLEGVVVVAVEDDPDALDLLKIAMEQAGALVVPASDAKAALETLGRVRPTVLVSDLTMPRHDGAWLVSEARRAGLLAGVPALVVTAITMTPQQVQEAGFDAYLPKPVDPDVLCETVRVLARHAA
jgi:DNA-binding response OmpR family regulator